MSVKYRSEKNVSVKSSGEYNKNKSISSESEKMVLSEKSKQSKGVLFLIICILGIYGSFLTWAVLQERISTTPYGADMRVFRASYAISAIQSLFAFVAGAVFLYFISPSSEQVRILPRNPALIKQYLIVAFCQTLSAPFSYASLKHVDYITMLLAKSCKLVPVMGVDLLLYRTKFPAYKYIVAFLVTLGVSLFSIYAPSKPKATDNRTGVSASWGFSLLGCGLFLDGVYNTTQDQMFRKFKGSDELSGPHMMAVLNLFSMAFSVAGIFASGQLEPIVWFMRNHPDVFRDIALFGICGAVGQIFIFLTLEHFGSLVLVTTTVTRKMISMLISVVMFNHKLTGMQWLGVTCVFGGIVGETLYKQLKR